MTHTMRLVRRNVDGTIEPLGAPLGEGAVTLFMHDTDLGGIVSVEPIAGHEGYEYLVTFVIDFLDARGTVEYLTNFDPHVAFPDVPATSHWLTFADS
jgi:hypothetical protein